MEKIVKKFKKILVTGPQRSGTRITAKIIARLTGLPYIDEQDINNDCEMMLKSEWERLGGGVCQAPCLSAWCHNYPDDVLIVWCSRSVKDIAVSEKRIHWTGYEGEIKKYPEHRIDKKKSMAKIKNSYFENHQRPLIKNLCISKFEDLDKYPEWVPKENRKGFRPDQTSPDEELPLHIKQSLPQELPNPNQLMSDPKYKGRGPFDKTRSQANEEKNEKKNK